MRSVFWKLSAAVGLTTALGVWRYRQAGVRSRPTPRQHIADSIDEVLYLTSNPVAVYPEDEHPRDAHAGDYGWMDADEPDRGRKIA